MASDSTRKPALPVVLVGVALLAVGIDRIAVPLLRSTGNPPGWHTALAYLGLYLFYFTGTLAAVTLVVRCIAGFDRSRSYRERFSVVAVLVAALIATLSLLIKLSSSLSILLEIQFAVAVVSLGLAALGRGRDLGVRIGIGIVSVPLLLHGVDVIGARFLWPDAIFEGPGVIIKQAGVVSLALAALATPYCFAPRPFAQAVTRAAPVIVAMMFAAFGAVVSRLEYPTIAKLSEQVVGVHLTSGQADPRLALYLLALATLVWTLTSCALATSRARRQIGLGLGLVVLGGYGFTWPDHYLLPLLGLGLMADAARDVREEELAGMPLTVTTPPIADATWASYITTLAQSLRRTLGDVHSLTARGDHNITSSVIIGEVDGLPVRIKIERVDGSVLSLDVVVGKEIDERHASTLTWWALPDRTTAKRAGPAGPSASPALTVGDAVFDDRFRVRGSADAFARLVDDGLRARAVASLDGWLAYWEQAGLRYRIYPGYGAPLDHPMPLSDLALGRAASTERVVAVVDLLVEIGRRGVSPIEDEAAKLPS